MDGDELGAVGERRLHLHLVEHLRHAVHHVVAASARRGRLAIRSADRAAVAGTFQQEGGDDRDGLGVVESAARAPAGGRARSATWNQQAVLLMRCEAHGQRSCHDARGISRAGS